MLYNFIIKINKIPFYSPVWISSLKCHKQSESLQTVVSSVYIISHEYVLCVRDLPTNVEQLLKIIKLEA